MFSARVATLRQIVGRTAAEALQHEPATLRERLAAATAWLQGGDARSVLALGDGTVIDESIDIMHWALAQADPEHWLEHEEPLDCGAGICLHTPGHTPGSMSFYFPQEQLLLSGDTLFLDSVGRTDLPGGNMQQLVQSIQTRLYTLDESTVVVPGHGPATTIGHEIRNNPFVSSRL